MLNEVRKSNKSLIKMNDDNILVNSIVYFLYKRLKIMKRKNTKHLL